MRAGSPRVVDQARCTRKVTITTPAHPRALRALPSAPASGGSPTTPCADSYEAISARPLASAAPCSRKCASRKKLTPLRRSVFILALQLPDASRKNALRYDGVASGDSVYNYYRDYNPAVGRYVESDPIGLAGGLNTYLYAGANPLSFTDPQGTNPAAGLDWPVRLLVYQDDKGDVLVLYTDFAWIAHRHGITDRDEAFKKAAVVIASITSTVK